MNPDRQDESEHRIGVLVAKSMEQAAFAYASNAAPDAPYVRLAPLIYQELERESTRVLQSCFADARSIAAAGMSLLAAQIIEDEARIGGVAAARAALARFALLDPTR